MNSMLNKNQIGAFVVIMLFIIGCKRSKPNPLSYASRMAGVHHWSGTWRFHYYNKPVDSEVTVSLDFPIAIVNDTVILVGYDSSRLFYKNSNDSQLHFSLSSYWDKYLLDTIVNREIVFNYNSNTIEYFRVIGLGPAYSENLTLQSP